MRMAANSFLAEAEEIIKKFRNPVIQELRISDLIQRANLYGYRPAQVISLVRRNQQYVKHGRPLERKHGWWDEVDRKSPIIPGWMSTAVST